MKLYSDKNECCGCGACAAVCQHDAIQMQTDEEGFRYPVIDETKCISCQMCESVCPLKKVKDNTGLNQYYGARADDMIRRRSSSGGMFTLLAKEILARGGIVYGAAFDSSMHVHHRKVESTEELDLIRRTKYVQSNIENVFQKVEKDLKSGRQVLFVGTPCQTEAVRKYLSCDKEKLYLVDIVCYGVPSPKLWEEYIEVLGKKQGDKISNYDFRDKRNKDNGHVVSWKTKNKECSCPIAEDPYSRIYFQNYSIRPSCHTCPFCTLIRNSDMTIGDFWGIEKIKPDLDDGMGNSLVIVHSGKGRQLWNAVKAYCQYFECEENDVLQPRLISPTVMPEDRKKFWDAYKKHGISYVIQKYGYTKNGVRKLLSYCKRFVVNINCQFMTKK